MLSKIKSFIAIGALALVFGVNAGTITHKVKKGETVYGISHTYGISMEELYKYNPSARDGIKIDQVLILPDNNTPASQPEKTTKASTPSSTNNLVYHTILKDETLYGISRRYNMTVDELLALNPQIDPSDYQAGATLRLTDKTAIPAQTTPAKGTVIAETVKVEPVTPPVETAVEIEPQPTAENAANAPIVAAEPIAQTTATPKVENDSASATVVTPERPLSIAVLLPFMLKEKANKKSQQMVEFYRGFALAADSLSHRGRPVKIYAYDTYNSLDSVKQLLTLPEVKNATVIIAPDNDSHLNEIAEMARDNGNWVFNTFAVKDTTYMTNPQMIQANIPHDEMYGKAIDNFVNLYREYTPVFLDYSVGNHDKKEFVDMLKKQLDADSIAYMTIEYSNLLTDSQLNHLNRDSKYVFVPLGSTRKEFSHFVGALTRLKEESIDPDDLRLFGYPEWTIFKDDNLKTLSKLNSSIYTRFYNDTSDYRNTSIDDAYKYWFKTKMGTAYPAQGLLGFDTGYFLIEALRRHNGDLRKSNHYDGVQTPFNLDGDDDKGLVNTGLYFVNFRPSGFIDKVVLW